MTVKPRCAREEVEELGEDEFMVRVKADPLRGRANKEALKLLAHHLGVSHSKVMMASHEGGPQKRVLIME
ncbi:MAG: DUF167 domain-containing protein [Candidatus Woesebacteria bacterium]